MVEIDHKKHDNLFCAERTEQSGIFPAHKRRLRAAKNRSGSAKEVFLQLLRSITVSDSAAECPGSRGGAEKVRIWRAGVDSARQRTAFGNKKATFDHECPECVTRELRRQGRRPDSGFPGALTGAAFPEGNV